MALPTTKEEWAEWTRVHESFDYRRLLIAYMSHMIGREGSAGLEFLVPFKTGLDELSADERCELQRLETEARETYP